MRAKEKATKEEAAIAMERLNAMAWDHHVTTFHGGKLHEIRKFIEAAQKRLPSRLAIDNDRIRKRGRIRASELKAAGRPAR